MSDEIKIDRKHLIVAVRQVLFNELFPAAKDGGKGGVSTESWRDWIKNEIRDAVTRWTRGTDSKSLVLDVVKMEVSKAVRELGWSRSNEDFNRHVRKLAQEEANKIVKRLIEESFAIDVQLSGNVHQPAKGQRIIDVSAEERSA